jgi:small subunit ribosomal protein S7
MAADFKKKEPKILPGSDAKTEKLINYIMRNGKKNLARRIFADILVEIRNNGHMNPNAVIEAAIENASPHIMVRSKRIGGAVYQVPLEVKANKKVYFALKWILDAAKSKS